ncbi:MAG: penicillin-binding transpeptidase domain-containing protein [Spirochaetes bacterium]|jgi:cell division protein FtsI/penicillin-binding protein 2|nr:penicillin-binding transpeptidase domain-containing protein [Spirochaetota bacterium]
MNRKVFTRRVLLTGLFIFGLAFFYIYRFTGILFTEKINLTTEINTKIKRGRITDLNGYVLAMSVESQSLFANPQEIENPADVSKKLSRILGYNSEWISQRLNRNKRFVWLKRKMDDADAGNIKSLGIKGLYFKKEFKRIYPQGRTASNIIGFTDIDNNGLEGIEFQFDKILKGMDGRISLFQNLPGIDERTIIEGKNITLTIDRFIQHISEHEIKNAVSASGAKQGVITVLEVKTGRILAIAKYPDFDPNYYNKFSDEARGNFSIVNSFEPGSTFKIIALSAIMEYRPEALNKAYLCDGSIEIGDAVIKCGKAHGNVNIYDIIKHSCNVGIIKAMTDVKKKDFYELIKRFGFGEKTGVELPGEDMGIVRPVDKWSGLSKYSMSIGHEISVTSIQLAAAFCAIGNGGIYLRPRIIEAIERPDGTLDQSFYPASKGIIIKKTDAQRILKMMREVVTGGTGEKADIDYYRAAGKTGTAQKYNRRGGYDPNRFVASFIGLAPIENPDVCILVIIDEPGGEIAGGDVAAPVFASTARRILPYRGVKIKTIPEMNPLKFKSGVKKFDGRRVPDFSGMSVSESLKILISMQETRKISYRFVGSGIVSGQSLMPNSDIADNKEIILYLREK